MVNNMILIKQTKLKVFFIVFCSHHSENETVSETNDVKKYERVEQYNKCKYMKNTTGKVSWLTKERPNLRCL